MEMDLPVPKIIESYSDDKKELVHKYITQLNDTEKQAYLIAYNHLGSSFNIVKSNGFKDWMKKQVTN